MPRNHDLSIDPEAPEPDPVGLKQRNDLLKGLHGGAASLGIHPAPAQPLAFDLNDPRPIWEQNGKREPKQDEKFKL